jgi:hypothetical protein
MWGFEKELSTGKTGLTGHFSSDFIGKIKKWLKDFMP